jgi:hypothetical protein
MKSALIIGPFLAVSVAGMKPAHRRVGGDDSVYPVRMDDSLAYGGSASYMDNLIDDDITAPMQQFDTDEDETENQFDSVNAVNEYDSEIQSAAGKTIIVTGANSGIGLTTTIALVKQGATVWIASRDPKRGEAAARKVKELVPGAKVNVGQLDLADLSSVRAFADMIKKEVPVLDVLINNAGVMVIPERRETKGGFEMQMGTNHFGHFALTGLLLPVLLKAKEPRVVTISSIFARLGKIDVDDIHMRKHYKQYRNSQTCCSRLSCRDAQKPLERI